MALQKEIKLNNGIIVNYHRIVSVNNITNEKSIIEVASYINSENRNNEKTSDNSFINLFIASKYYNFPYDKDLTIDKAYTNLKTLDDFKNSIDV